MTKELKIILSDIKKVEKLINYNIEYWERDCCKVSALIIENIILNGQLIEGDYSGYIDVYSTFAEDGVTEKSVPHCWIQLNNYIIDPTKWVFTKEEPFIYIAEKDFKYIHGELCKSDIHYMYLRS